MLKLIEGSFYVVEEDIMVNEATIQRLLQQFPIFKDLTDSEMKPMLEIANHRMYRQGTHIFMQGDPLTNVYFIQQGKVKIYRTDFHGKEQIVNVLQTGDMFPHQGFFRKDDYPAHAEVAEDAVLIYIPITSFENILTSYPEISIKLLRVLGDIIVDLQTRLEEKILRNTYEQIILLLLRLGKSHGNRNELDDNVRLTTQFTNKELANMIGSSRETVSRTLSQLKKNGIVTEVEGFLLLDTKALENELF